jgi:DNA-binding NarL/FixJ family response regulator
VTGHDDPPARVATVLVVAAGLEHRNALHRELAATGRAAVVGDARDARDCVSAARRLRPDVAVLWLDAPRTEALAVAGALTACSPHPRVLLVTAHRDVDFLRAALTAGVTAYVPAGAGPAALGATLDAALHGHAALPAALARELAEAGDRAPAGPSAALLGRLTRRELDVLRHVAEGLTNAETALRLGVSPGTVKVHVERLIAKLGVDNRTQAAVHAARAGLLDARASGLDGWRAKGRWDIRRSADDGRAGAP